MPDNTLRHDGEDLLRSPMEVAQQMYEEQLENALTQLRTSSRHESTDWLHDKGITLKQLRDAVARDV